MATKKNTKTTPVTLPANSPLIPYGWELPDVTALQNLAAGTATPEQQKRALDLIINCICRTYDQPFRPGTEGARDTDFACGMQFAGQQIVKLLKLNKGAFTKKERETNDRHEPEPRE